MAEPHSPDDNDEESPSSIGTSRLQLLWEVDGTRDGRLESVPGVSINANWLRADLSHFSKYVMASN